MSDSVQSAVLFFPGGGVDPYAYLPLNRKLAENGILSIIVKLPWRFAPFDNHKDEAVNNAIAARAVFPFIENWTVCGHSKGGEMGALLAQKHASQIDALVLIGTSHPKRFDLSHLDIPVKKIYGTLDGVAPPHKIRETADNLPEHTQWIQIEGANHAQFGYYGPQLGDNDAAISREKQQKIVVSAIIETVKSTDK